MATQAITTKGTTLAVLTTPPSTFTTVAEVLNISGPTETTATIDATSFDSLAKEYISSALPDVQDFTFEMHWVADGTNHQLLRANLRAGTKTTFKLTLPDTTTVEFEAFVTNMSLELPLEGKITHNMTLKPSGLPTWTYPP